MRTLLALAVLAAAVPSSAATSELLRCASADSFASLGAFKPAIAPPLRLEQTSKPLSGGSLKGARTIRLSGYLNLNGSGYLHRPSSYVTVTLTGSAYLRDQNGSMISGSVTFSDTNSYFVSGSYVSGWARPAAYVSVYENGKYLGNARVDGSFTVSGWYNGGDNGGFVSLSGSGNVSGDLYVSQP